MKKRNYVWVVEGRMVDGAWIPIESWSYPARRSLNYDSLKKEAMEHAEKAGWKNLKHNIRVTRYISTKESK